MEYRERMKVCPTGAASFKSWTITRDQLAVICGILDIELTDQIEYTTDALVATDLNRVTAKRNRAQMLGTAMYTMTDFLEMLRQQFVYSYFPHPSSETRGYTHLKAAPVALVRDGNAASTQLGRAMVKTRQMGLNLWAAWDQYSYPDHTTRVEDDWDVNLFLTPLERHYRFSGRGYWETHTPIFWATGYGTLDKIALIQQFLNSFENSGAHATGLDHRLGLTYHTNLSLISHVRHEEVFYRRGLRVGIADDELTDAYNLPLLVEELVNYWRASGSSGPFTTWREDQVRQEIALNERSAALFTPTSDEVLSQSKQDVLDSFLPNRKPRRAFDL